jgi:hypothetical protein
MKNEQPKDIIIHVKKEDDEDSTGSKGNSGGPKKRKGTKRSGKSIKDPDPNKIWTFPQPVKTDK